ncbi:hypothetical protein ANN_14373 [Periplaneta americana]|uniref:Uncharacterized protein n=1 Tax=Periplaneta americana TaxID=6978 RepID=A0ABQ8SWQ6_PERAM|nr:hypothetical protein ANN_14373 [Periplaneta americana]
MWLADEPREFNLPTFPQRRITYVQEKLPGKYGVHSEEYLQIRTLLQALHRDDHNNDTIPRRWIGRGGEDQLHRRWPPRSPDFTPCDFYLWSYVKDRAFIPPMPDIGLNTAINSANAAAHEKQQRQCGRHIPEWLKGNFVRLGPGKFDLGDFVMNHWFDGYAVLYKFNINNGKVTFSKRFLQSDAYKRAVAVGRPVFTEFGTKSFPDPCKNIFSRMMSSLLPDLTDNDAINVFTLEDAVFVATETNYLRRIDLSSLETMEKSPEMCAWVRRVQGVFRLVIRLPLELSDVTRAVERYVSSTVKLYCIPLPTARPYLYSGAFPTTPITSPLSRR